MAVRNLTFSVFNRLAGDALLVALLSRYATGPAIFTSRPIPGDALLPWIVAEGHPLAPNFTVDALSGQIQTRDIEIFTEDRGGAALADMIAQRVSVLFTFSSLTQDGFIDTQGKASPGIVADEDGMNGRKIRVSFFVSTLTTGTVSFEFYEVPAESPDGSRTNFSTSRVYMSGTLQVMNNGYPQKPGVDFTEDADLNGFTMTDAFATGSDLFCQYHY